MNVIVELLKTCIPIIIGALIAIVPTMIEKNIERKQEQEEKRIQTKQEIYVELVSLFGKVLKGQANVENLGLLRDRINLISITGSVEVVKALNGYIDTWGHQDGEEQNRKYCDLLKAMRVDLKVDNNVNDKFPQIGLRDISVKRN